MTPTTISSLAMLALLGATAGPARGQATDARWLPWMGCWAPSGASDDAAPSVAGVQRVCVMPAEGSSGVDIVNVTDGRIASRLRVDATGSQRALTREGCTGWESAQWSADAERLFFRSELTCSGSIGRTSSGIIAVASPSDWVDVQIVRVGDQRSTRVLRYRSVVDTTALGRQIADAIRDRELARQTARLAAASTPTIGDVIEASRQVDAGVVEAWLLQRMPRFTVDAAGLTQLANAKVPTPVIDMVVALGAPERFSDRIATRGYTFVRIDQPRAVTVAVSEPQVSERYVGTPSNVTIEIRDERVGYSSAHRHYDGCGHYGFTWIGGYLIAPYAFYPYWPYADYRYNRYRNSYGDGYDYLPYQPYDPYRPAPQKPVTPRGQTGGRDVPDRRDVPERRDIPDRRAVPTAPTPAPEPAPQPEGGRVVKGQGYTRPAGQAATAPTQAPAAATQAPAPVVRTPAPAVQPPAPAPQQSGSRGQAGATTRKPSAPPPAEVKPAPAPPAETKSAPAPTEPARTAKRRPPANQG